MSATAPLVSHIPPGAGRFSFFPPLALLLIFLAIALIPIWCFDYLAMQDYPQHLFQAKETILALNGYSVPAPYQVHLKPTYSAFYLIVWVFNFILPLASAGRVAISLYLVLVASVCWKTFRYASTTGLSAWPALLLFPIAFNALFFWGFVNYLYAMPLLWLLLLDLIKHHEIPWTLRRLIFHALSLTFLLFIHPFAIPIYALVVITWLAANLRRTTQRRYFLIALLLSIAVACAWSVSNFISSAGAVRPSQILFNQPLQNAAFILNLFTGLRGIAHPDLLTLFLWFIVVTLSALAALRNTSVFQDRTFQLALLAVLALAAAVIFTPFGVSSATYLNLRIAAALYFLLALALTRIRFPAVLTPILILTSFLLLVRSVTIQYQISQEVAEINPLIAAIQPNAQVLPLIFDRDSPTEDGYYFSPHLHDHFYYQIQKGGITPYLLEAPAEGRTPLFFTPGKQPPAPGEYTPEKFRWESLDPAYRYFLVRGGSPSLFSYLNQHAIQRVASGKWRLYECLPNNPPH